MRSNQTVYIYQFILAVCVQDRHYYTQVTDEETETKKMSNMSKYSANIRIEIKILHRTQPIFFFTNI